jgi:phosphoribosylamine--glycine ligase
MAARGYPGAVEKGTPIRGLDAAARLPGVSILHAATRREGDVLVSDGGRVLAVTALGRDVVEAQSRAYAAVDRLDWPGGFCRRDIGWRAIERRRGS